MGKRKQNVKPNRELMELYKAGSIEARDELFMNFKAKIESLASDYFNMGIENKEIISCAYEGLLLSLSKFKEKRDTDSNFYTFITYNTKCFIENFILKYFDLPLYNKSIMINILKAIHYLTKELKRIPTLEEIKEITNYDLELIEKALNLINRTKITDLPSMTLEELREVKYSVLDPEYMEIRSFFRQNITTILNSLPLSKKEKEIFNLIIVDGKTVKEIQEFYNLSRNRVYIILQKGLKVLKESNYAIMIAEGLLDGSERNAIENEIIYERLANV